jgi:hypothetical protein
MMRNRWSLPVYGPVVKISETVMVSEVMVKSIVEAFWEVGLMRVQKFGVVIRQALRSLIKASLMDLPNLFLLELGSHCEWWPLKSLPPRRRG